MGTLGVAVPDFNGDGRLDVVEAQGEAAGNMDERMHLACHWCHEVPQLVAVGENLRNRRSAA